MTQLAAFVGHSFTKDDDEVVSCFLNFLNKVQDFNIGFAWEHAEYAEPKVLSEKVKAKMAGKNLFIGICTAKENAISPDKLTTALLRKNVLQAARQHFEPKTSDWVTQEIGYALGRGMEVILLLEEGVRRPGGLQGDLEHIAFDRSAPTEAFPKLLEMIRSLRPKSPAVKEDSSATAMPEAEQKTPRIDAPQQADDPPSSRRDFEHLIFKAHFSDDVDKVAKLRESFAKTPEGADEVERDLLEAFSISMQSLFDRGGKLERSRELASKYPSDSRFARYLARAYEEHGMHDKAAEQHLRAAALSDDKAKKSDYLTDAAIAKARAGDDHADAWLRTEHQALGSHSEEMQLNLLWALATIAQLRQWWDRWFAYQEARLLVRPDNQDLRFELAHKYSDRENNKLALFHYLKIPAQKRVEGTWNNLGAAARSLDLKALGITNYQESKRMGGTLAVSNLAYVLIQAGFIKEAEELCKEALKLPECDRRVGAALASIDEENRKEDESKAKLMTEAEKEHVFMIDFGQALAEPNVAPSTSKWKTPDCEELVVHVSEGRFEAVGTYEKQTGGLGLISALTFGEGARTEVKKTIMVVTYAGHIAGRGCVATKVTKEEGKQSRSLLDEPTGDTTYLILEQDRSVIREMRKPDKQPAVYEMWQHVA